MGLTNHLLTGMILQSSHLFFSSPKVLFPHQWTANNDHTLSEHAPHRHGLRNAELNMGVKPSTTICAKVDSLPILGMMVIPPLLTGNPYNPYYWVDGHPLLHGKSQVVSRISEPSTVRPTTSFIFLPSDLLLRCPYGPSVEVVVMQSHGMCPQIEGTKWAATFWGSFQWMVQWSGSSRRFISHLGDLEGVPQP